MTTELSMLTERFPWVVGATAVSQEGTEGIPGEGGQGAQTPGEAEALASSGPHFMVC